MTRASWTSPCCENPVLARVAERIFRGRERQREAAWPPQLARDRGSLATPASERQRQLGHPSERETEAAWPPQKK